MSQSFFQTGGFVEFQGSIPYRKAWIVEGTAVIQLKHRFGLSSLWIPYGPVIANEIFFDGLAQLALKQGSIYARIEPSLNWPQEAINNIAKKWAMRPTTYRYTPEYSLIVNLSSSEHEILAQMKPKGRYNIKVAQKHGVTIGRYGNFAEIPQNDFDAFYRLLIETAERDRFGIHPKSYYKILLAFFRGRGKSNLFLAYNKDKTVIAGAIVVCHDNEAIYYYGALSHAHRALMAPYLLHWEIMRTAKKEGMKRYDLFGIAPENEPAHPWHGVGEFKKKFGGTKIVYPPAFDIIYRPILYRLLRLLRL